jgi:alanine dehydrogenase
MRIGIPRETKDGEHRVALTPQAAGSLVRSGHAVVIEHGAGAGSGFADSEYEAQGARVVADAAQAFAGELVV